MAVTEHPALAHVHQVSLSDGGVPKRAVPSARITKEGLIGDRQRNRKFHGGPDRAVCLYSLEIIVALRAEGHSIGPGSAGENLTVAGMDWPQLEPGDRQRNRKFHGGPDRAVCLYSLEIIEALRAEGHSIGPGSAGENLTVAGIDWSHLEPGDRLGIGPDLQLEITSYTAPCRLNGQWFKDGNSERMAQEAHPGWSRLYARVLVEGTVHPGDPVRFHHSDRDKQPNEARP